MNYLNRPSSFPIENVPFINFLKKKKIAVDYNLIIVRETIFFWMEDCKSKESKSLMPSLFI